MLKKIKGVLLAVPLVAGAGVANAAVDAAVTTAISGANTDIATIGALVLGVHVGIKLFKWIRGAL